jgi:hypothetical protein
MKAKNSNPELNYNLNEGKHKKTLLEKYLNHWNGDERSNGSVNLEEKNDDFADELVETSSQFNKSVVDEYKEFLNKFESITNESSFSELEEVIESKKIDDKST